MKKLILTSLVIVGGVSLLHAQETGAYTDSLVTPQFFIAVIAGVLLALGFQFILTVLSVALGITAIGDIREKYVKNKNQGKDSDDDSGGMSTGTKVTGAFGVWSIITVGLSLFGATALAINLSLITSSVISITLGLVVWATFFILLFYLESRMVNTLVGGLINTATAGLRASGNAVREMFSSSKEQQMKNVAEDTVDKIRKDFQAGFDPHVINEAIDEFFNRVDKNVPDYEKLKKDIEQIVEKSTEDKKQGQDGQSGGGGGQAKWMAIQQVFSNAISETGGNQDQDKKEQLKQLQKELKQAYDEGDTREEKMEKVAAKLTSEDEEEIHSYVEKIKEALSTSGPGDMDQDRIKDKLMQIVKNPEVEGNKLAEKLKEIDRETIISFLSENTALKRDQIETYADKAEEALQKVITEVGNKTGNEGADASELKEKLQREVSKFMNNTGKSKLDPSMLTRLVQEKFDDQKNSLQGIKKNLSNMDKDALVSAVTNNTNIDQEDIDKVVNAVEEAKNNVLRKVEEIEQEANRRVENMKRKAVVEAENTRKIAASAAWWLVISAIVSAGTAIAGSLVAMG